MPITESSSISEVAEFLQTSFQPKDVRLGVKILTDRENALKAEIKRVNEWATDRENALKAEIQNLKRVNEYVSRQPGDEIRKTRGELEKLKTEKEDLIKENAGLKREIESLKDEKKEAEERFEASEKRFVELDAKLSRLEEEMATMLKVDVSIVRNLVEPFDDLLATGDDYVGIQNRLENTVGKEGPLSVNAEPPVVVLSDDEDEMPKDNTEVNEMGSCPQMNEEKGERLQRKRSISNIDGDSSSLCKRKQKHSEEVVHEIAAAPVFNSPTNPNCGGAGMSCAVPTYESIARVKCEAIVSPTAGKCAVSDTDLKPLKDSGSKQWKCENDMHLALLDDEELCMRAICALYRKLISAPITLEPIDRGFEPNDCPLGVTLAEYLIDGHPEKKPSRPMLEVYKTVVRESKRLALQYSGKLFRIYSSGEDPLFCPNSISSKL